MTTTSVRTPNSIDTSSRGSFYGPGFLESVPPPRSVAPQLGVRTTSSGDVG